MRYVRDEENDLISLPQLWNHHPARCFPVSLFLWLDRLLYLISRCRRNHHRRKVVAWMLVEVLEELLDAMVLARDKSEIVQIAVLKFIRI